VLTRRDKLTKTWFPFSGNSILEERF